MPLPSLSSGLNLQWTGTQLSLSSRRSPRSLTRLPWWRAPFQASLVSMQDEMAEVATENSLLRDELSELQARLEANVTKLTELEVKREAGQAVATRLEASLA